MPAAKPFSEDMTAAKLAFEKEEFYMMNIIGNRIMSNAIFLGSEAQPIMLAGFFVKDIAMEMLNIAARGRTAPTGAAKAVVSPFLSQIEKHASGPQFDSLSFWKSYGEYNKRIRKFGITEIEDKSYSENTAFAKLASKWLLDYLRKERLLLVDPRNQLLEGVLNELSRIYRAHGADLNELLLIAILDYLQKFYSYVRFASSKPDGDLDPSKIESEVNPRIDEILGLFSGPKEPNVEDAQAVLAGLILSWREYFIRYMELRQFPGVSPVRGVELPEETKKKITEAITKTLEKDTKQTKKR